MLQSSCDISRAFRVGCHRTHTPPSAMWFLRLAPSNKSRVLVVVASTSHEADSKTWPLSFGSRTAWVPETQTAKHESCCIWPCSTHAHTELRTMQNHNCGSFNPCRQSHSENSSTRCRHCCWSSKHGSQWGQGATWILLLQVRQVHCANAVISYSNSRWYKALQPCIETLVKKSRSTYAISAEIDQSELIFIRIPSSAATAYWIRWEYCEDVKPHIKQQLVGPCKYDPSPTTNMQLLSKFMLEGCTKCGSHSKLESG